MPVGSPIRSTGGSSGIKMFISWSLSPTQRHRELAVSLDRPFSPGRLHYKMLLALDLSLLLRLLLQVTMSPVVQLHKSNIFTTRICAPSYPIWACCVLSWGSADTRVRLTGKAALTPLCFQKWEWACYLGVDGTSSAGREGRLGGEKPRGTSKAGVSCLQSLDITLDQIHRLVADK